MKAKKTPKKELVKHFEDNYELTETTEGLNLKKREKEQAKELKQDTGKDLEQALKAFLSKQKFEF